VSFIRAGHSVYGEPHHRHPGEGRDTGPQLVGTPTVETHTTVHSSFRWNDMKRLDALPAWTLAFAGMT